MQSKTKIRTATYTLRRQDTTAQATSPIEQGQSVDPLGSIYSTAAVSTVSAYQKDSFTSVLPLWIFPSTLSWTQLLLCTLPWFAIPLSLNAMFLRRQLPSNGTRPLPSFGFRNSKTASYFQLSPVTWFFCISSSQFQKLSSQLTLAHEERRYGRQQWHVTLHLQDATLLISNIVPTTLERTHFTAPSLHLRYWTKPRKPEERRLYLRWFTVLQKMSWKFLFHSPIELKVYASSHSRYPWYCFLWVYLDGLVRGSDPIWGGVRYQLKDNFLLSVAFLCVWICFLSPLYPSTRLVNWNRSSLLPYLARLFFVRRHYTYAIFLSYLTVSLPLFYFTDAPWRGIPTRSFLRCAGLPFTDVIHTEPFSPSQ